MADCAVSNHVQMMGFDRRCDHVHTVQNTQWGAGVFLRNKHAYRKNEKKNKQTNKLKTKMENLQLQLSVRCFNEADKNEIFKAIQ